MLHRECSVPPLCNTIASDVWLLLRQKLSVNDASRNVSYWPVSTRCEPKQTDTNSISRISIYVNIHPSSYKK